MIKSPGKGFIEIFKVMLYTFLAMDLCIYVLYMYVCVIIQKYVCFTVTNKRTHYFEKSTGFLIFGAGKKQTCVTPI